MGFSLEELYYILSLPFEIFLVGFIIHVILCAYCGMLFMIYISITLVPSYTGKYHEFVAICIVTSAQHK